MSRSRRAWCACRVSYTETVLNVPTPGLPYCFVYTPQRPRPRLRASMEVAIRVDCTSSRTYVYVSALTCLLRFINENIYAQDRKAECEWNAAPRAAARGPIPMRYSTTPCTTPPLVLRAHGPPQGAPATVPQPIPSRPQRTMGYRFASRRIARGWQVASSFRPKS